MKIKKKGVTLLSSMMQKKNFGKNKRPKKNPLKAKRLHHYKNLLQ